MALQTPDQDVSRKIELLVNKYIFLKFISYFFASSERQKKCEKNYKKYERETNKLDVEILYVCESDIQLCRQK